MDFTKLYRWLAALVLSGLIAGGSGGANASPSASGIKPGVETSQNGLSITWTAPEAEITTDQDGKTRYIMPGFDVLEEPGLPVLPVTSELITLPPGADPQVYIESIQESAVPLPEQLALGRIPEGIIKSPDGEVIGGDYVSPLAAVTFSPNPIEIEHLGVMRGVNLASVKFYPVRPVGDELRITRFLQARIDFNIPSGRAFGTESPLDPLQESLMSKVINPGQLQPAARVPIQTGLYSSAPQAASETAIIEVKTRGLYKITYQDLIAAGFPANSVNTSNLTLYRSGANAGEPLQKVAVFWEGNSDQTFENWEKILFYAEPRYNRWVDFDTYLLKEEDEAGKRIATRSAPPSGLDLGRALTPHLEEQNNIYTPDCYCASIPAGRSGDHWAWDKIQIPYQGTISSTYEFNITNVDETKAGNVTVWLMGFTDLLENPDHKVQIFINEQQLYPAIQWDGKKAKEVNLPIPASVLNEGNNSLTVRLPGIADIEGIYLDAFQVNYPLGGNLINQAVYFQGEETLHKYQIYFNNADQPGFLALDVTNPNNPIKMIDLNIQDDLVKFKDTNSGKTHAYFLTSIAEALDPPSIRLQRKHDIDQGDYILIAHHDFLSSVSPLVSLRQAQGHTVSVIDVRTIYDNYGFGKPAPESITAFLENAYHNWVIQPLYVLLVGDGTSDPRGYLPGSYETFIPPYLADVDPWAGETAADNRYVTVDPPDDIEDILPDLLIGRLPVNSVSELNTVINKIVNYETNPPAGDWRKTITITTDDPDNPGSPINNFPEDANYLDNKLIPSGYSVNKIIYPAGSDPDITRENIRSQWSSGSAIMTYIGHGAIKRWGKTFEGFWLAKDLDSLSNGPKHTFVFEMTCLTGKFQSFEDHSFDELALKMGTHGAVAAWGGTGLGVAHGHMQLAEGFYDNLFYGFYSDLGLATQSGKLNLMKENDYYKDLVDTYVLFGDPATRLQMPRHGGKNIALPFVYKQ